MDLLQRLAERVRDTRRFPRRRMDELTRAPAVLAHRAGLLLRRDDLQDAQAVLREVGASYWVIPALFPAVQFPATRVSRRTVA